MGEWLKEYSTKLTKYFVAYNRTAASLFPVLVFIQCKVNAIWILDYITKCQIIKSFNKKLNK